MLSTLRRNVFGLTQTLFQEQVTTTDVCAVRAQRIRLESWDMLFHPGQ
jgi:hypothetical protein